MGDINPEKDLLSKNYELIADKAKIEVKLAIVEGEYNLLKQSTEATAKAFEATQTEFAILKTEHSATTASVEEFNKTVAALEAAAVIKVEEFVAAEVKIADALAFKAAYVAVVEADGVKIAREADYASKSLTELQALHAEYLVEIAKLPSGQQSQGEGDTQVVTHVYSGIPENLFKTN